MILGNAEVMTYGQTDRISTCRLYPRQSEINTVELAASEIPQIFTTILAQQKAQLFTLQKKP